MVKDEMCNTYIPEENALKEKLDGQEYYFCSKECREKFLEQRKKQKSDSSG
jgi:YHS domain-containing protein